MSTKTRKILMWVLIGLLSVQFLGASVSKFMGNEEANFIRWGYSPMFAYIIGVLEIMGVIGLYIPKFRSYAAFGIIGIMLGAAFTHATHNELPNIIVNVVVCALAFGITRLVRPLSS
jgi:uncharacterized membrane protein YphA (DoxX/SURF4 family)